MKKALQSYIDHTLLKPESSKDDIKSLCDEARQHEFAAVCVLPVWTAFAYQQLKDSSVKVCSVVGFPLGSNTTEIKMMEAAHLVTLGATEIDMVIHVGALKDKHYNQVQHDIQSVVQAANPAIVKVILETCLLTDEEKKVASLICVEAGAHFVKTSTGFSKGGATIHDVALIRNTVGPNIGVKASGGIRDYETALAMIDAGATRLGTSASVAIVSTKV